MSPSSALFRTTVTLLLSFVLVGMVWAWRWAIRQWRQGSPLLPPETPRMVPWGIGSVLLVVFTWFATNLAVVSVYMVLTRGLGHPTLAGAKQSQANAASSDSLSSTEQMVLVSVANLLLIVAVPLILRMTSRARLADLGVRWDDLRRQVGQGVMAFLLITPVVYAFNALAVLIWTQVFGKTETHTLEKMVRNDFSGGVVELAILSAVLFAPAAEELIFRGILQGWLARVFNAPKPPPSSETVIGFDAEIDSVDLSFGAAPVGETKVDLEPSPPPVPNAPSRRRRSRMLPVVAASALFAVVHLPQWPAPLAIFFLSLGLGAVFERTGSLISTFTMHAMFNALGTLLLFQSLFLVDLPAEKAVPAPASMAISPATVSQ